MGRHDSRRIRATVTQAYAKAVSKPSEACCSGPVQKGVAVKLAGYTAEQLNALPPEAVVNAFGCGNPLAFGEVKAGDVVLDLGSGAGIDILLAGIKVGPSGRAIGIDMTDEMIAKARENIAAAGLSQVEVRKGIIEELPVESSSVDWVISNCVINLSPEKHKVFSEIARVLKPGGHMRVSDIVVEGLPAWVLEDEVLYSSCVGGAIGEKEYIEGLRAAGLVDIVVRERLVYDAAQLRALIRGDASDADPELAKWLALVGEPLERIVESLSGKIWSATFSARKPDDRG